jgi:hypothetical protein
MGQLVFADFIRHTREKAKNMDQIDRGTKFIAGIISACVFLFFLLFFSPGALPVKAEVSSSTIITYYKMDTYHGGNWVDDDFNLSNSLPVLHNDLATTTGKYGYGRNWGNTGGTWASAYAGDSSSYQHISSITSTTTQLSLAFWYRTGALPSVQGTIYSFDTTHGGWGNNGGFSISDDGRLRWCKLTGDWYCLGTPASFIPTDNAWHSYVIEVDLGTSNVSHFKVYKDGVIATSSLISGTEPNADYAGQNVGDSPEVFIGSQTPGQYGLPGDLDDMALFRVLLTDDDVLGFQGCAISGFLDGSCSTGTVANPFIYAYGWPYLWSNPSYYPTNALKQFNLFWDICADYPVVNKLKLQANLNGLGYDPGVYLVKDKTTFVGPQACKGSIQFSDNYTNFDNSVSGTANFTLTEYDASNTPIASSTSNTITYITDVSANYIDSTMVDPLNLNLDQLPQGVQTATSTHLFFSYNFVGRGTPTNVCLWDYYHATSTGYCDTNTLLTTGPGLDSITVPTPTINTDNAYRFYATFSGTSTLWSDIFNVIWSHGGSKPFPEPACIDQGVDYTGACSSYDTSTTWGIILCAAEKATISTWAHIQNPFTPTCNSIKYLTGQITQFKQAPPFSMLFDFTDTIKSAIDTAGTATSTTLGLGSVPMINASGTIYMLPVLSSSSMTNMIGSSNVSLYRQIITWIIWIVIVFLAVIIIWSTSV